MNYDLNNLGSQNFENLVQSLCKKIIGEGVSIFGAGPDGQREATFDGKTHYPSESEPWDGYWVIQAKFKNPDTKTPDLPWIKECFEKEMDGFQNKKSQGKTIPKNYLFFTNIVLTPAYEKGIKDRMNALINDYTDLIPHIHILGANDIYTFLDNNRDVATAYSSYILSGDILNYLYDNLETTNKNRQKAFMRYLIRAFNDDSCSRMEQAGQVTDNKTSIDKVYVDLTFEEEFSKNSGKFIKHALTAGNSNFRFSECERNRVSPLELIGEETLAISNKYVLKGSAGQGKSTICQFLAQIYRAYFIKNFSETNVPEVNSFIDTILNDGIDKPSCYRIPIKIELRLYSSWIIKRQQEQKSFDIITYISSIIAEKTSDKFDNDTLRLYLSKYSWVFFFDGLDEVPESSNRNDIMKEIEHFINIELRQADTDSVFFATTRPEGYVGEFNKVDFSHLNILPLDKNDCFSYLDKLLLSIENDDTKRKYYHKILNEAYSNDQIAFMMRTPLQATIMAILIKAGGEPPRDKYSLFKDYFDIIIKREKQKGTGGILNNNQDLIESVYFTLGYELQEKASTTKGSDSLVSSNRLKELISVILNANGISTGSNDHNKLLYETYHMIVNRINFASEIKEGFIGFPIRSMQEYLASEHIVKTNNDEQLGILLKNLAKNSYWKNTFIFVVEGINKNKPYFLNNLIDTVLNELNGSDISIKDLDELSSVCYGSQIAFSLLANNIFKNKLNFENKLCKHIKNYCILQPNDETSHVLHMSDNVKKELTNYILEKDGSQLTNTDFAIISFLLQDVNCRKTLNNLENAFANEIAIQYINLAKGICAEPLLYVISTALNNGILLPLTTSQLAFVIKNSTFLNPTKGKNTAFKILIKSALKHDFLSLSSHNEIFNNYFNCDIQPLSIFRSIYSSYEYSMLGGIKYHYKIPQIEQSKLNSFISLAEQFDLKGLCLILKTINSKKIDDYILFYQKINLYKDEILSLGEDSFLRCNCILDNIWKSFNAIETFDENAFIMSNIFQNKIDIASYNDVINEYKKDFSLYRISSIFPDHFLNFYPKIRELLSLDEIKKIPRLCKTILCMYAYQHKAECFNAYGRNEEAIQTLDSYLEEMFELLIIDNKNISWYKYIWGLIFLRFPIKDYFKFSDVVFSNSNSSYSKIQSLYFSPNDSKTILNNLINYIQITDNRNGFSLLYDFVLTLEYKSMIEIDFSSLKNYNDKKIFCLIEFAKAKTKEDVISKIIPLLSDKEVYDYIYKLSFSMNLPSLFLPLYIFYLKKYREISSYKEIKDLELKIKDYIASTPVSL